MRPYVYDSDHPHDSYDQRLADFLGGNKGAQRKLQVDEFVITGAKVHVAATMLGSATVPLPEIRLTNLGQSADGITAAELSRKVMSEIVAATTKAVAGNASDVGKGAADQLKKGASGIGDLFKKK